MIELSTNRHDCTYENDVSFKMCIYNNRILYFIWFDVTLAITISKKTQHETMSHDSKKYLNIKADLLSTKGGGHFYVICVNNQHFLEKQYSHLQVSCQRNSK